jgi:hypothetical protein
MSLFNVDAMGGLCPTVAWGHGGTQRRPVEIVESFIVHAAGRSPRLGDLL